MLNVKSHVNIKREIRKLKTLFANVLDLELTLRIKIVIQGEKRRVNMIDGEFEPELYPLKAHSLEKILIIGGFINDYC
ncbi:hypothetical protein [Bacillus sp. UNC41MFS5]|uniref:hypothetical protein n=1 Tax=Bacillus sp. UNC41MFS5 TaxID=1449046 RepID=UPI00047E3922|nr:hypothetical protein [Bacillus sp. UNC41MFS5]